MKLSSSTALFDQILDTEYGEPLYRNTKGPGVGQRHRLRDPQLHQDRR